MSYRFSGKAEDDIISVYLDGVRDFGVAQAERYHKELEQVFGILAGNPYLARMRGELTPPVRIHPHGSHLIVYHVEDNEDVLILRIRHAREDWVSNPET